MKILDEFRDAKGFDTWTCLTYGADLAWFEHAILHPLQAQGVRRFMIFADQTRLSLDLDASPRLLGGMGRSYLLHGVASRVTFHPKLYLLSGERRARLYVGSGNLSRGGLDRNLEVFERWDAADDTPAPAAFDQARRYLEELVSAYDGEDCIEREHLDLAFRFNRRGVVPAGDAGLLASPPALIDRLPPGRGPCTTLRMVAPFFDSKAEAVAQLADRFAAARFEVIVHPKMTNITSGIVRAIERRGGRVLKVQQPDDPNARDRPIHGKLLYARGRGWSVGIVGSANLSLAAWKGHNHELVSVRVGTDADAVGRLIDALTCEPLTDEDLEFFDRLAERRTQQDRDENALRPAPTLALRHARWLGSDRMFVQPVRKADEQPVIEIRGERGIVRGTRLTPAGAGWEVDVPAMIRRGAPCLVRAAGDPPGAWAVVQDHSEVRASARAEGREREMLDQLLESPGFDMEGVIRLMELLASIQQSRVEQQREEGFERAGAGGPGPEAPEVRNVSLNDFEQRRGASGAARNYLIPLPSVRLMNRLLFGDEAHAEGSGEDVEVELTDEDDGGEEFLEKLYQMDRQSGAHESPIEAMGRFLRASQHARERYLATARGLRSDPFLLLDDIMLLAAPLHYMMRGRGISEPEFRAELVPLLRELACDAHSPLLKSIRRLDEAARAELWTNTPTFVLLMLWVYNACLADAVDDARFSPLATLNVRFGNSHPVLWLRHIVRLVPPETLGQLLDALPSTLPRLRTGIFWLGRRWRERIQEAPFEAFVRATVADALALDRVEEQIRWLEPRIRERERGRLPDNDEQVVALGERGLMAIGWAEPDTKGRPTQMRSGAFEAPEVQGVSHLRSMRSPPLSSVMRLDALLDLAIEEEGLIDMHGLEVIEHLQ